VRFKLVRGKSAVGWSVGNVCDVELGGRLHRTTDCGRQTTSAATQKGTHFIVESPSYSEVQRCRGHLMVIYWYIGAIVIRMPFWIELHLHSGSIVAGGVSAYIYFIYLLKNSK